VRMQPCYKHALHVLVQPSVLCAIVHEAHEGRGGKGGGACQRTAYLAAGVMAASSLTRRVDRKDLIACINKNSLVKNG
jgi:hypothetical protein